MAVPSSPHRHDDQRRQPAGPGSGPDDHGHGHDGHGGPDEHGHEHGHDDHEHGHDGHGHDHDHPGGLRGLVMSVFAPHSHDTGDTIAAALTATDEGVKALKVSLAILAVTAAAELAVVLISGSVALLSDTIHNFADALTAVPLGVAFWMSRRPPDERYTYGYGRAEDLAGIFIVAIMTASSVLAAWEAVNRLAHPQTLSRLGWVAAAGVVGFVGNETVAVYRTRVGRRIGSAALVADGMHARTDGLTSLAVVAGAIGVAAGWKEADPVVGLLITVAILLVLKNAARDIYRRLMDSVDPALVTRASEVLSRVAGVEEVTGVRLRWVGHELLAEAAITADGRLTLVEGHAVAEAAYHELLHRVPRLAQAIIHVDPSRNGVDHHTLTAHHFPTARPAPGPGPDPDGSGAAPGAGDASRGWTNPPAPR
ncbi:MAG TPA: cation diffusion facilitator family transporter [Acidimicrobiales bacterium]|nr:cation diffusion facilitator family transporter [Acidimicrobiales bacterium]